MMDVCFAGNSSIDIISNSRGTKKVFGGSAVYSAFSCRSVSNKNIGIISNVNKELKAILEDKRIELFGNVFDEINTFSINEDFGTCKFLNMVNNSIELKQELDVDYLHISFRKGVDVDSILNNSQLKYNHLSIDVMIHSIDSVIESIKKYIKKIDLIFCNSEEYQILKDIIIELPTVIVTNQDKPVVVIENDKNSCYSVPQGVNVTSSTGAGDTFIGGFLAEYSNNCNFEKAINKGIENASNSVVDFGPINHVPVYNYITSVSELPKNIIVIGNSCAGKTTFIDYFKSLYNIYTDIDDLAPLLEMFMIDDVSSSNDLNELKELRNKLLFMKDIHEQYIASFPNIDHYSIIAKNGSGHDIIKPELWDIILEKSVKILKKDNNIIQFSRGKDEVYEKKYGTDVYNRSLDIIMNQLVNKNNTIIINLVSNLETRKKRNRIRFENGGHFVSEDTMNNVYKSDIFKYEHVDSNKGFINVDGRKYPVYTINNDKMLSSIELQEFLRYNVNEILEYYREFKEDLLNGYERNTERNMAK